MTAQELRSFFSLLRSHTGSPPYLLLESVLNWFADPFPDWEVHPVISTHATSRVYGNGVFSELSPRVSKCFASTHRGLQNQPLLATAHIKTLSRRDRRELSFPGISTDGFWLALPSGPPPGDRTWLCLLSPSAAPFTGRKLWRWMRALQRLHQSLLAARLGDVQEREKQFALQEESIAFLVHQLKAPLSQIQGALTEENGNTAGQRRELRQLVSRTREQVTGYLNLYRARRLKLQWVSLRDLTDEIRAYYRAFMNDSLIMDAAFRDARIFVWGNKMYLFEVFQNLIDNARQAMENRGRVYLEAVFADGPKSMNGGPLSSNGPQPSKNQSSFAFQKISLRVRDEGPGIPRWFHPKLFQPFAGLKPEGHGLGLCLCQRLVQHMEGSLEFSYHSPESDCGFFQIKLTAKGGKHEA